MSIPRDLGPDVFARAERDCARALADAAASLARLDERLAGLSDGALSDLAEHEVVELCWAQGDMLAHDRLLLWTHAGLGQGQLILRAAWAVRRLVAPASAHAQLGDVAGLRAFLALAQPGSTDPALDPFRRRMPPERWAEEAEGFLADLSAAGSLHPLTRGCAAYLGWHWRELGEPGDVLEAGVIAARVAASGQGSARFAPLVFGNRLALRAIGQGADTTMRLGQFLDATRAATDRALGRLARMQDWRTRAMPRAGAMPGRLPTDVVRQMGQTPIVSANLMRDRLGVTQQAANAALRRLAGAGLIEEVSGQRRYRVWRARL